MESRGPEDSKNVKTSQAYFFEGFISFFEDFSLTINIPSPIHREIYQNPLSMIKREIAFLGKITKNKLYENEILDLLKL